MNREQAENGARPDGAEGAADEQEAPAARRTRGGSSYQHSLSARGIKSSGRARSCSDQDLLSSMERLDRATRLPSAEEEETRGVRRAYGRRHETGTPSKASAGKIEQRALGPRFEW